MLIAHRCTHGPCADLPASPQALEMLGLEAFEDIYNFAAPDFVHDDPKEQQEW